MKVKKITAACSAGLGNRIKCMMSTLRICDEERANGLSALPCVYWPNNKECGCEFEELFERPWPLKDIGASELQTIEVDEWHGDAYINKSWKLKSNAIAEPSIDFKYHKLTNSQINKFLPHLSKLKPKQDIVDAAWAFRNKYKESFDKKEVIAVQIRRGDFTNLYDGRGKISKESDFIEKMRCLLEVNLNYKFMLSTDDEDIEERLRLRFGDSHILIFPRRFKGRETPEAIKEAFVNILLLAECHIIIGTFLSTFTEMAWWFGGCKAQVVIPGTENKKAVDKVISKLPQEGEGIHKKIYRKLMTWKTEGL